MSETEYDYQMDSPDCSNNPCDNCKGPNDLGLYSCKDCEEYEDSKVYDIV